MNIPKAKIDRDLAMQLWQSEHTEYAKEQVIVANLGLVGVVLKSLNLSTQDEDLFSTGVVGLVKALNTYDIEKGYLFATYATKIIKNEILQIFRKKRVDIAFSLDDEIEFNDDSVAYSEFIQDKICVEDEVITRIYYKDIMDKLSEREQVILTLRLQGKKQKHIAEILGLSQSYISRIIEEVREKYGA